MNELERRLRELGASVIIQDLLDDWEELRKTEKDLSAVVGILLDDNFNWMKLDSKNELLVHFVLIELVSKEKSSPRQQKVLKELRSMTPRAGENK